jgi:hypothetical protein
MVSGIFSEGDRLQGRPSPTENKKSRKGGTVVVPLGLPDTLRYRDRLLALSSQKKPQEAAFCCPARART